MVIILHLPVVHILPANNADIIVASTILYFSSLILSSVVMINFYSCFIRFFLKLKGLSKESIDLQIFKNLSLNTR